MSTRKRRGDNEHKIAGTREYAGAVSRFLRKYGERAHEGKLDTDALEQLREIHELVELQTAEVVRALRSDKHGAHSWAEIGRALGITRAAAFKRYGGADDTSTRRPGGQPGHLR